MGYMEAKGTVIYTISPQSSQDGGGLGPRGWMLVVVVAVLGLGLPTCG